MGQQSYFCIDIICVKGRAKKKQNCAKVSENATRVNLCCLKTTAKHDSPRHFCTQIARHNNTISRTKNEPKIDQKWTKNLKIDQKCTKNG